MASARRQRSTSPATYAAADCASPRTGGFWRGWRRILLSAPAIRFSPEQRQLVSDETSMVSKYLIPLRVLAGMGRRASALSARRAKESRHANAKAWLGRCAVPIKANVGCGQEPFQGWTNLDLESNSRADILWDVTEGLPFENGSCAYVYCEHFLEHLPV